jgi:Mce-associated membrane protein
MPGNVADSNSQTAPEHDPRDGDAGRPEGVTTSDEPIGAAAEERTSRPEDDGESGTAEPATDSETAEPVNENETSSNGKTPKKARRTRAERLEAKATRLREAERARQEAQLASTPAEGQSWVAKRARWLLSVAAALVVILIAATVILSLRVRSSDQTDAARASALSAARQDAEAFGTYHYQTLNKDFAAVTSHLTRSFAKNYSTVSSQLRALIQQYHGSSSATIRGAAVQSISGKQAVVLVFLDQSVTTNASSTPRIDRNRLQMTLQRQPDGSWLVSNLTLV